jgi:hypothetical protein
MFNDLGKLEGKGIFVGNFALALKRSIAFTGFRRYGRSGRQHVLHVVKPPWSSSGQPFGRVEQIPDEKCPHSHKKFMNKFFILGLTWLASFWRGEKGPFH